MSGDWFIWLLPDLHREGGIGSGRPSRVNNPPPSRRVQTLGSGPAQTRSDG